PRPALRRPGLGVPLRLAEPAVGAEARRRRRGRAVVPRGAEAAQPGPAAALLPHGGRVVVARGRPDRARHLPPGAARPLRAALGPRRGHRRRGRPQARGGPVRHAGTSVSGPEEPGVGAPDEHGVSGPREPGASATPAPDRAAELAAMEGLFDALWPLPR